MDINWGIIGTGQIAKKFAEDYKYVTDGRILAVASRQQVKADEFADVYGIERAYGSYEDLAKDKDIHAVYIATPHSLHYTNSLMAMKANKAVLCEKPVAVNSRQLKELADLAKARELPFMEAMWTYFLPPVQQAMRWIQDDEIGEVQFVNADFGFSMPFDPQSRVFDPQLAGGALLDVGIYPIAIASLIKQNRPQEIKVSSKMADNGIDLTTLMNFSYKDGAMAQLTCSVEHLTRHEAIIYGAKGSIFMPDFWRARKAILKTPDKEIAFEDTREAVGYHYEIEEMNKLIAEGKTESDIMPVVNSFLNMHVMDAVREQMNLTYPFE